MAASRKLQGEIERCMKKVIEGVETFQDIWQKVHNATNTNQKEKYEADLKKEIKKLQRLRDQIKTWIACAEIKDKSTLLENRRLIETQMERFKVIERETKTKAYSKEGLGAIQKMDPAQKEKEDVTGWLIHSIDILNFQVDQFESEIESLTVAGKKKRVDKDKQDKVEELRNKVEKHRFHTKKLETLLRMLDNMSVEVRQVKRLKEDVEYYIDASQDVDFQENEFMYDDIVGIDDVDLSAVAGGAAGDETETISTISGPSSPSPSSPTPTCDSVGSNPATTTAIPTVTSSHSTTATPCAIYVSSTSSSSICSVTSSNSSNSEEPKKKEKAAKVTPVKPSKKEQHQATAVSSASTNSLNIKTAINHTSSATIITTGVTTTSNVCTSNHTSLSSAPSPQPGNFATVAASNLNHNSGSNPSSKSTNSNIGNGNIIQQQSTVQPTENGPSSIVVNHVTENEPLVITTSSNECTNTDVVLSYTPVSSNSTTSLSSSAPSPTIDTNAPLMTTIKNIPHDAIDLTSAVVVDVPNSENNPNCIPSTNGKPSTSKKKDAHITPLLGVAPLGPVPLSKEIQHQFDMMESAFYHMPHPVDSERAKPYLSRIPAITPAYYNQVPLPNTEIIDFYHRLTTDTLFFIFYYMEGTKAQYLAAKALKKQSWRFHTKYLMWFQRHEEPKTINEEYEQGTYVYFDYEKWIQRRKEGFTFEYKYLEDRDLS